MKYFTLFLTIFALTQCLIFPRANAFGDEMVSKKLEHIDRFYDQIKKFKTYMTKKWASNEIKPDLLAEDIFREFSPTEFDCQGDHLKKFANSYFEELFHYDKIGKMYDSEYMHKMSSTSCTTLFKDDMADSKAAEGSECKKLFDYSTKKRSKKGDGPSPSPFTKDEYLATHGVPFLYAELCCKKNICLDSMKKLIKGKPGTDKDGMNGARAM